MAATLFGTNLVAIILSSAGTFFILGVRGDTQHSPIQRWVRRTMLALAIFTACLAIPLGISLVHNPESLGNNLRASLQEELEAYPEIRIGDVSTDLSSDPKTIEIELFSPQEIETGLTHRLSEAVKRHMNQTCDVRIIMLHEWRSNFK